MAAQGLTDEAVEQLAAQPQRYEVFDALTPGLAIRVTSFGHKSWVFLYRHDAKLRRLTLGTYPDLTLAAARLEASRQRSRIRNGADPAAEKRLARAIDAQTVGNLYELFKRASHTKRSWPEQRRILEREVLPMWRHVPVQNVSRKDIRALVYAKAETAPIMANRVLARISRLFSFAVELDWLAANPASRIRKPGEERRSDRVLSRDQLRELWGALSEGRNDPKSSRPWLSQTLSDMFKVMLLTAQRRGEVSRMRWVDVDLKSGWWTIPATLAKNGQAHRVPLTSVALQVLQRRATADDRDDYYVFSNHRTTCVADRSKKAAAILCRSGLPFHFRAHDLRRTAASYMAEAGVDRLHIAYVLNHRSVTQSTVTAIYDRYGYDREKRAALERWVQLLVQITGPTSETRELRPR